MTRPPVTPDRARETRLLVLIVAVSVAALLLLAQLRFPETPVLTPPTPSPLERLAARATYEELAGIVRDLERRLAPVLVVLRVSAVESEPADADRPGVVPGAVRFVPGVRVRADTAVAVVGPEETVVAVEGSTALPAVRARDPDRGLIVAAVPAVGEAAATSTASQWPAGRYAALVDATEAGFAIRPVFLTAGASHHDPLWVEPLIAPPPETDVAPGTLVFTFDGQLVAAGVPASDGSTRFVRAAELRAAALERLAAGTPAPGDLGIEVVPLTPAIALATGARVGVVVSWVEPGGPSEGVLAFGDVIEGVAGRPLANPREFVVRVRRAGAGATLPLTVVRRGERGEVTVTVGSAREAPEREPTQDSATAGPTPGRPLGLTMRTRPKAGVELVRVAAGSAAERAGLQVGDLVTHVDDRVAPTPTDLARRYAAAQAGTRMLVGVTRGPRHLVLVLEKS